MIVDIIRIGIIVTRLRGIKDPLLKKTSTKEYIKISSSYIRSIPSLQGIGADTAPIREEKVDPAAKDIIYR